MINGVPLRLHNDSCASVTSILEESPALLPYLCPERRISFDGFINYEGRRFGVPYKYSGKTARIRRSGYYIYIYSSDLSELLATHEVTWSRRDSYCADQYVTEQPEELPTSPVRISITEKAAPPSNAFDKFDFDKEESS